MTTRKILCAVALLTLQSVAGCDCGGEPVVVRTVELRLVPDVVDFGDVPLGARRDGAVVIRNSGNAAWEPTGVPVIDGPGFAWVDGCDAPVAPGGACTARLTFTPPFEGGALASFTVRAPANNDDTGGNGDGGDINVVGRLEGRGTPATLVIDPPALDFGAVVVGASRLLTVNIENRGIEAVELPLVIAGAGFFVDGATSTTRRLEAGASTVVDVAFAPVAGIAHTGTLTAEICGVQCGPLVTLAGRGDAPRIDVQPRQLDLGAVARGSDGRGTLRVENVGSGALAVEGVAVDDAAGSFTLVLPALPVVLAGGEGFDVEVVFAPDEGRGSDSVAVVTVRSTDPVSGSVLIPVLATSPGPGISVIPRVGNYGFIAADAERSLSVVIRSTGDGPVDVLALRLEGDTADFSFLGAPAPGALDAGDALQFFVVAHASPAALARGGGSAILVVESDAGTESVNLTFAAGDSGCVPVPVVDNVALGAVQVGLSKSREALIENIGDADCVLTFIGDSEDVGFGESDDDFTAVPRGLAVVVPGGRASLAFGFAPTTTGPQSTLRGLYFEGRDEPLLISASGNGVRGGLVGAPSVVTVGPLPRGCGVPAFNVAFFNDGASPLNIDAFTLDGGARAPTFAVGTIALPRSLFPGQTVPLAISTVFGPAVDGLNTTILTASTVEGLTADIDLRLIVSNDAEPITQNFVVPGDVKVDVLFVVDNSGSMADDQRLLADNFAAFIAVAFDDPNLDVQLGVTTTDVISPEAAAGRLIGQPAILGENDGDEFAERVIVGIEGTGVELGLEAMRLALEAPENANFVRSDAALAIIFVTDEDDSGDLPFLPPELSRSPDEYIALLEAKKAGAVENTPVLVSAVLSPFGSPRYRAVVDHFGGGVLDITTPDWGSNLSQIAEETFALASTFALSVSPRPGTVSVTIDGVATTAFTVDTQRRAVVLDEPADGGSDVVITFLPGCGP